MAMTTMSKIQSALTEKEFEYFRKETDMYDVEYCNVKISINKHACVTFNSNPSSNAELNVKIHGGEKIPIRGNILSQNKFFGFQNRFNENSHKVLSVRNASCYVLPSTGQLLLYNETSPEINNYDFYVDSSLANGDLYARYLSLSKEAKEIRQEFPFIENSIDCHPIGLATRILKECFRQVIRPQHVFFSESKVLLEASSGPVLYANKGKCLQDYIAYDINSFYPWLMIDKLLVPIRKGTYVNVDELPIQITKENMCNLYKLDCGQGWDIELKDCFPYDFGCLSHKPDQRKRQWFTMFDIQLLRSCTGYVPKLYCNNDNDSDSNDSNESNDNTYYTHVTCNCLMYAEKDLLPLGSLLGKSIEKLYQLKKVNNNKMSKKIINSFWGLLSEEYCVTKDVSTHEYEELSEQQRIVTILDNKVKFKSEYRPMRTFMGRIKPFILSLARLTICSYANHVRRMGYDVARIHTDCFVTNCPRTKFPFPIDDDIGSFKIEKEFNEEVFLKNVNAFTQ